MAEIFRVALQPAQLQFLQRILCKTDKPPLALLLKCARQISLPEPSLDWLSWNANVAFALDCKLPDRGSTTVELYNTSLELKIQRDTGKACSFDVLTGPCLCTSLHVAFKVPASLLPGVPAVLHNVCLYTCMAEDYVFG